MDLDDLMQQVTGDDPLSRLSSAMTVKADLDDLADSLIGHHVDQARKAGHSWSEIGAAMGVTKQAAQQRHSAERPPKGSGRMFTRFTAKGRQAIESAQAAAKELDHGYIGTEHLLLGVLDVRDCTGSVILDRFDVTRADVVTAARDAAGTDHPKARRGHTPFTPKAKRVLELALREALAMKKGYVGTEHIVLAMFAVEDGVATSVMRAKDITRESLLEAIAMHEAA
ncbi:MAG TPA: Clp protease N-terminal domain-containing protein [Acidimicrobiales bacterium]|nr:Clp protease N-terminal domain-containing protein [Acidimicrobiales bacterium]